MIALVSFLAVPIVDGVTSHPATARETHGRTRRQSSDVRGDRLLNMRLNDEVEAETFTSKDTELRDLIAKLTARLEVSHQKQDDRADFALKVFELSQAMKEKCLTADYAAKRRILETVALNFRLDGVTLVPEWRKPFDALAEGLSVQLSRGDKTPVELFVAGVADLAPDLWRHVTHILTPPSPGHAVARL